MMGTVYEFLFRAVSGGLVERLVMTDEFSGFWCEKYLGKGNIDISIYSHRRLYHTCQPLSFTIKGDMFASVQRPRKTEISNLIMQLSSMNMRACYKCTPKACTYKM